MDVTDPRFLLWATVYVIVKWTVGLWTVRQVVLYLRQTRRARVLDTSKPRLR